MRAAPSNTCSATGALLKATGASARSVASTWRTVALGLPEDIGRGNAWAYTVAILTLIIAIFYMKLLYGRGDIRS